MSQTTPWPENLTRDSLTNARNEALSEARRTATTLAACTHNPTLPAIDQLLNLGLDLQGSLFFAHTAQILLDLDDQERTKHQ
jgi:hypothetical protein